MRNDPTDGARARAPGRHRSDEINKEICKYNNFYGTVDAPASEGDADSEAIPSLVDKFYSLVTDIYILGWGESFHFAPVMKGERWEDAMVRHEVEIGTCMGTHGAAAPAPEALGARLRRSARASPKRHAL